jgi:predicted 3-demethylubiquinone-9 3-methyltransferase (glyoxalase superfamily)
MQKITPFIWFNDQAEEAMTLYAKVFKNAKIISIQRAGDRVQSGTVELDGLRLHCFNGGPHFKLNEAVSLMVDCETQAEVDHLWAALTDGGSEQPCGWLKDRFGVSWQITPRKLVQLLRDPDPGRAQRAAAAMMKMKKIDIAELERAAA